MSNGIKPKVDDQYWFNFSENLTNNAISKRDEAAVKLQNLVLWLWGIYTASAAVGFTLSGKSLSILLTILIASASAGLIAVYWGTIWVQMPKLEEFDPRSPTEIRDVYSNLVITKQHRLNLVLGLSIIAAIMVSLSLILASVPQKPTGLPQQTGLPDFDAAITGFGEQHSLTLTGSITNAREGDVTVSIQPVGDEKAALTRIFKLTDRGLLQVSIPLEIKATAVRVTLEWITPNNMNVKLSKEVKAKEQQNSAKN